MTETDERVRLITVHGTGAGAKRNTGDRWWQLGSPFLSEFCDRLGLTEDNVEIIPHQWKEGPNSEAGRRVAGAELMALCHDLDARGAPYYLLGHSHGGSVIYSALLQSIKADKPFVGLQQWCTVGTPFLEYKENRFMFQRLSYFGLTIYSATTVTMLVALSLFYALFAFDYEDAHTIMRNFGIALLIFSVVCFVILYVMERRHRSWFTDDQKQETVRTYEDRWLGLWHLEDEAISALYNIRDVSGPIIPPTFLQPAVPALQLLLIFGYGIYWAYDSIMGGYTVENVAYTILTVDDDELPHELDEYGVAFQTGMTATLWVLWVGSIFALAWVLKLVVGFIGKPLSILLNSVIWNSVRQRAWGDDLIKEDVCYVGSAPPQFDMRFGPVPETVAKPLRAYSDHHAISTLNNVRQILGMAGEAPRAPNIKNELTESLKWKELIHTAYFEVPEFIDLLAIGMSKANLGKLSGKLSSTKAGQKELEGWIDAGPKSF